MYQKHSETSKDAYHGLKHSDAQRERIYNLISNQKTIGTTGGFIAQALDMQIGTVSARLMSLQEEGRIIKLERQMINPSGMKANVYVAAKFRPALDQGEKILPVAGRRPSKNREAENVALRQVLASINYDLNKQGSIHKGSLIHSQIKTLLSKG